MDKEFRNVYYPTVARLDLTEIKKFSLSIFISANARNHDMKKTKKMTLRPQAGSAMDRRRFLTATAKGAAASWLGSWPWQALQAQQIDGGQADDWDAGSVQHLLPCVSDRCLLLKASFSRPLADPPQLRNSIRIRCAGYCRPHE